MTNSVIDIETLRSGHEKAHVFGGVYFLFKGDELVYIGQSVNVHYRLQQHRGAIDFDAYTFYPCKKDDMKRIEAMHIRHYKPKHNIDIPEDHRSVYGKRAKKKYGHLLNAS